MVVWYSDTLVVVAVVMVVVLETFVGVLRWWWCSRLSSLYYDGDGILILDYKCDVELNQAKYFWR